MYLVLKGFANNTISAVKGKVVKIDDKKLASSLLDAGYIAPYSEKEMSNKEAKETIAKLQSELVEKDNEIQSLKDRITELETELNSSEEPTDEPNENNKENSNLDENNDLTPNEDVENNGEESTPNEDIVDDKKSSKK